MGLVASLHGVVVVVVMHTRLRHHIAALAQDVNNKDYISSAMLTTNAARSGGYSSRSSQQPLLASYFLLTSPHCPEASCLFGWVSSVREQTRSRPGSWSARCRRRRHDRRYSVRRNALTSAWYLVISINVRKPLFYPPSSLGTRLQYVVSC